MGAKSAFRVQRFRKEISWTNANRAAAVVVGMRYGVRLRRAVLLDVRSSVLASFRRRVGCMAIPNEVVTVNVASPGSACIVAGTRMGAGRFKPAFEISFCTLSFDADPPKATGGRGGVFSAVRQVAKAVACTRAL